MKREATISMKFVSLGDAAILLCPMCSFCKVGGGGVRSSNPSLVA